MNLLGLLKRKEREQERERKIAEFESTKQEFYDRIQSLESRRDFILIMGICSYEALQTLSEREVISLWKVAHDKMTLKNIRLVDQRI